MTDIPPIAADVRDTPLADALGERYLSYALSTIMSRSLPDVRDGLKPVHRRLLHAMRELKLDPGSGFKKCARIVGDVMGKYHPHGDQAIYDAMVRLAQDFAVRYPLVDGQGNFGNVDGDNPAAMRYTEARLTDVAERLLDGIDDDTVDFRETYDGEGREPMVLPADFPNLLANGAAGIAVGMATSIPPHNVAELCDALLHLIKTPNATIAKLVELIPGPDFPTGGVLVEDRDTLIHAYKTGRGSFRVRSRWQKEKLKGGVWQIVVTEIPYQVQKARLIEKMAEQLQARKLPMLADVRDESAEDIRIVLEPRSRNVDPTILMEQLFRLTDLETRFGLNMNVLDADQTPRVMNLREVLQAFLDHRQVVLQRRTRHRIDRIEKRLEVLGGYMVAYLNLDEVIRIVREADDPKAEMMAKWDLTDVQADAILNMRLRSLRRLEEIEIREELKALEVERQDLGKLLKDTARQWQTIGGQIREIKKAYGPSTDLGKRRTGHGEAPDIDDIPLEAMIDKEPVTVICSEKGWIRTVKGHLESADGLKYKDGDRGRFLLHAQTTDKLILFGTDGRFYTMGVDRLPGGRGHGEPVRLTIGLGNDSDIVHLKVHVPDGKLLVAASDGRGFIVLEGEVLAQTRGGKAVLTVRGDVEATACTPVPEGADHVAVVGQNRKLILFPLAEMPELSRGRGMILQRYKDGGLSDAKAFAMVSGLECRTGSRTRTFEKKELDLWIGQRAQAGRIAPQGFPRDNRFG